MIKKTNMTKEELFKMMNEHPVLYVATNENGQPHVWCMEDNFKPKEYIEL